MIGILLVILILLFSIYAIVKCTFWRLKGIDGPLPVPIFGNLFHFVITKKRHIGEIYKDIYDSFKDARYVGIFKLTEPAILIRDLDLVRDILVSNFNTFNKNDFNYDPKMDPLINVNPFLSHGDQWKNSRSILSPLFSPSKIKMSVESIAKICKVLDRYLEGNLETTKGCFDVKDIANKFTTDVIVDFALSEDGESFTNPNAEFKSMGDAIFKPTFLTGLKQQTVLFLPFMNRFLNIPFIPKSVNSRFRAAINRIADKRFSEGTQPNDLFKNILDNCMIHKKVCYDETFVAGHTMSVVKGAYETSSTNMAYALYELALNSCAQTRVQEEVDAILEEFDGEINKNALDKMEYLDLCIMETARMHCPFFHTSRVSLQKFKLPSQYEHSSLQKKVEIEAGTIAVIPIHAIHYDPNNFPDPTQFNPERWTTENRSKIPKHAFLGFGEGPRLCIGMKFGIQQVKAAVATILSKYTLRPYKRTDIPEKFSKATFNLQPENGIWLKFVKRQPSDL